MGKLLNKLVHGFVPSWLTKVKSSSPQTSLKNLLPFSKGSSISASASASRNNSQQLPPLVPTEQSVIPAAEPSSVPFAEGTAVFVEPSPAKQKKIASTKANPHSSIENDHHHHHHHQVYDDTHHLQTSTHKDTCDHRNQQQYHENRNISGLGPDKRPQFISEALNPNHRGHTSRPLMNGDSIEFCNKVDEEAALCMPRENFLEFNAKEHSLGAEISHGHYRKGYHDLLGLKRKSQYLLDGGEEDEEEEGAEEEEEKGSHRSGDMDMTEWGWKRRKGERGLMSCELPESICCIVGNGRAVVKESLEPHMAMWESMVEMIVGNGLWDNMGNLEFLLFCYLSLNEPHLHPLIQSSFLQVLRDLEKTVA